MYNLLISSDPEAWAGNFYVFERPRCITSHEYTAQHLVDRFGGLDANAITALRQLPCIFACETGNEVDPVFGQLTDVSVRQNGVRIEYRLQAVDPFLTFEELENLSNALDIGRWELRRTHWAVKNVNLPQELSQQGIVIPAWARERRPPININHHQFDVALSFPGQARGVVQPIADEIERVLGPNRCFYDHNYRGALARPNLDTLLQDIYGSRSRLLVVFISGSTKSGIGAALSFARSGRSSMHESSGA